MSRCATAMSRSAWSLPPWNIGEHLLLLEAGDGRQVARQGLAKQQHERILGLRARSNLDLKIDVRGFDDRLCLLEGELVRRPGIELRLHDFVIGVGRLERIP